jgi:hypothetical protein
MIRVFGRFAIVAIIAAAVLAVPTAAAAQGLGVGVKGGYLYSSFKFDEASDVIDSSNGWMAGVFFGGNRPGTVGVMGEVNILAKRGSVMGDNVTLYYAQIPVLLRINGGSRSRSGVSAYGIVGPAVDIKIGESLTAGIDADDLENADVSIVGGVGVELNRFIIEGRGTWGLRSLAKDGPDVKSRTFALLVGVRFN